MLPPRFTIVAGSAAFNGVAGLMLASMLDAGLATVWGVVGFAFGAVAVLRAERDDGH